MKERDSFEMKLFELLGPPDRPVAPRHAFSAALRARLEEELEVRHVPRPFSSMPQSRHSEATSRTEETRNSLTSAVRRTWILGVEIAAIALLMYLGWDFWTVKSPEHPTPSPLKSAAEQATPSASEIGQNPGFVEVWRNEGLSLGEPFVQPVVRGQTLYRSGKLYDPDDLLAPSPEFEAIDLATGQQKWIVRRHIAGVPIVTDTTVFILELKTDLTAGVSTPTESALVALHTATGQEQWSVPMGRPSGRELSKAGQSDSWLVLNDGTIYATDPDGTVYAVDSTTGSVNWVSTLASASGSGVPRSAGQIASGDDRIYVANPQGDVVAIDVKTQNIVWSFNVIERFEIGLAVIQPFAVNGQVLLQISAYPIDSAQSGPFTILTNIDPSSVLSRARVDLR